MIIVPFIVPLASKIVFGLSTYLLSLLGITLLVSIFALIRRCFGRV